MLSIGEFSQLAQVSVITLRHYDQIGLFRPAYIHARSGYRYYLVEQLEQLYQILMLKEVGYALEEIHFLLQHSNDSSAVRELLFSKYQQTRQALAREQTRLEALERLLQAADQGAYLPTQNIVVRAVPSSLCAMQRLWLSHMDLLDEAIEETEGYVTRYRARKAAPVTVIYHTYTDWEKPVEVEIAIPLTRSIPSSSSLRIEALEAASPVASIINRGGDATLDQTCEALWTWLDLHSYRVNGPDREVYHRARHQPKEDMCPSDIGREQEIITEFQVPIRK
ncbi:MerR family transcriptional regulator [Ktedonosporobacter rubrisoli]|uniref:MerR family transcriptional regulator n=1 Tax=Ktedonosporobacter rubrisoli TaxID=2509675 RepID=A0A4P6JY48_KTERU|nr:MerR family transcriptional regulator [Ktedonosporobacter rubrisoli]QBD80718.1 MerR family transcriptional regulator [Ktedonosporobacter rubrisoli]